MKALVKKNWPRRVQGGVAPPKEKNKAKEP
jgi:hypothetical protein